MFSKSDLIEWIIIFFCQVKAAVREQHLEEEQAKLAKPKRKRGKVAVSAPASTTPPPASPDRVAKKAKSPGDEEADSEDEGDKPEPSKVTGKAKTSKRKGVEEVREAWKEKERFFLQVSSTYRIHKYLLN